MASPSLHCWWPARGVGGGGCGGAVGLAGWQPLPEAPVPSSTARQVPGQADQRLAVCSPPPRGPARTGTVPSEAGGQVSAAAPGDAVPWELRLSLGLLSLACTA